MIIPADRQAEEDYVSLGQIRAGQAVRHYETFRQRKDGTQLPISLYRLTHLRRRRAS